MLFFSPDYWPQRLEQETCFGSPNIRAAKPAEATHITFSDGAKKNANQTDHHLPSNCPALSAALC